MTTEAQLLNKKMYETYLDRNSVDHPFRILGKIFMEEHLDERVDLSTIRFAQGELYFHHMDYESAIFKWENIQNELRPWAQKNMADAYSELGLFSTAEDIYKTITSDSLILMTEVILQLFKLYIEQGNDDLASLKIKEAIALNPDYQNIVEQARVFFEEQRDWQSAVDLAINEAIRTESLRWFSLLIDYIQQGYASTIEPNYFFQVLTTAYRVDRVRFERLVIALWNSYQQGDLYFTWLEELYHLVGNMNINQYDLWQELITQYKEAYYELLNGHYYIREIERYVPGLLTSWMNLSEPTDALEVSAAILAWSEIFPSSIESSIVHDAETFICQSDHQLNAFEYCSDLFESVMNWAENNQLDMDEELISIGREIVNTKSENQTEMLVNIIRKITKSLLEERIKLENDLMESIKWDEQMLTKLNGAVNQLDDLENDKYQMMKKSYHEMIATVKNKLDEQIPILLKRCSEYIHEDSDFRTIHFELNDQMNKVIQRYLEDTVLPNFFDASQNWIKKCQEEFDKGQLFLQEMCEGFNALYGEERLLLECDVKIIDDWRRDTDRLTNKLQLEKVNILLRRTPAQLLLKSAGKLFGAFPQNQIVYNKYKTFVENEDYAEVTSSIIEKFLMPFTLFEDGIERDVIMFFRGPLQTLNKTIEETRFDIQDKQDQLNKLKSNPEVYRDPLTLFGLSLRQYEWIEMATNGELQPS